MSLRLVVLISGSGSNLQAILDACGQNPSAPPAAALDARVVGVLSNRADAYGLTRAADAGVPTALLSHRDYADREGFDQAMIQVIDAWQPDVIILAGFMRILTPGFVGHYSGRLINIHPSLLPRHKGLDTHQRALDAGDAEHGCSVHYVTAELDGGPVIAQAILRVKAQDTADTLTQRVHALEHRLYPAVIGWLAEGRLSCLAGQPLLTPLLDGHPLTAPLRLTEESA